MTLIQTTAEDSHPPLARLETVVLPPVRIGSLLEIRTARADEAIRISTLISSMVPECVPMSPTEITLHLRCFDVAVSPEGAIVATASVRHIDPTRVELRGLAVDGRWRGHGLGRLLVQRAIRRAVNAELELVCVTRKPAFFEGLGFKTISLKAIPDGQKRVPAGAASGLRVAMEWCCIDAPGVAWTGEAA